MYWHSLLTLHDISLQEIPCYIQILRLNLGTKDICIVRNPCYYIIKKKRLLLWLKKHTWINDSQCAYSVVFSTCCAQFNIIATVVMDTSFGQHGLILYFRFPQGWAGVGEDDRFRFALSDHFQSLFLPQHVLSTFHNQLEPRVDRPQWLFRLLCGHHLPALDAGHPQPRAATKMAGERKRQTFLKYAFIAINFPLSFAFTAFHKFW